VERPSVSILIITFAFARIAHFETNFLFLWCNDRSFNKGELRTGWILKKSVATSLFTIKSSKGLRHKKKKNSVALVR
jgi:hypothetical protein